MSFAKYIGYHLAEKVGLAPQASAGTVTGSAIDRKTYDHLVAFLNAGSFAGTGLDVHIEDSADGSTGWADFTPNVLLDNNSTAVSYAAFPQMTTTGIDKLDVDLSGAKRYIRFIGVSTGGSITYGVSVGLGQRQGANPGA